MEIVPPGFRPILRGMRARIGGDVILMPIRERAAGVKALQRSRVVACAVSEQSKEAFLQTVVL